MWIERKRENNIKNIQNLQKGRLYIGIRATQKESVVGVRVVARACREVQTGITLDKDLFVQETKSNYFLSDVMKIK